MGKIFDALQKSTRKPEAALNTQEAPLDGNAPFPFHDDAEAEPPREALAPSREARPARPAIPQEAPAAPERKNKTAAVELLPAHKLDQHLVAVHMPHSFEAEQFRMLRTNLLFPKTGRPAPRTILVTSALPGEGKSFVSANLAATIAQNVDHHVLLIDADMRHPTIHTLFGLGQVHGLSEYLNDGRPIPELLRVAHTRSLSILPGGRPPSNPAELLSSRRMAALLREVKTRYDDRYIIIDSPPPQLTSESNALAQFVDGIIIVVKFDTTPRELVTNLIDNFDKNKVLGVVANWTTNEAHSYYGSEKYIKKYAGKRGKVN